jgi:hypothetical protein
MATEAEARTAMPVLLERRDARARDAVTRRVRGEFEEMPCLRLTLPQARRLFALREDVCRRVLGMLVREGVLAVGPDGRYLLRAKEPARRTVGRPACRCSGA